MRLLIGAGGTGGGVYPALAVKQALTADIDTLWVGSKGGMESTLVQRAGIKYTEISAAGVHGVGIRRLLGNLYLLLRGLIDARRIVSSFKPDSILLTGGFLSFPIALAAGGIPITLFVPDIEPGLALKAVSHFAKTIAVTAEASGKYFSNRKKIFVTGYPVRQEIARWNRKSGRHYFSLAEADLVIFIFGGSKGARSINDAILDNLDDLLNLSTVIHVSGELDWAKVVAVKSRLSDQNSSRYHAFPYLHEDMGAALAAADLVISRAGASILGEFPQFGLPAILVPYPHAWRYQVVNANYLVEKNAAILLEDHSLKDLLLPTISEFLANSSKREAMGKAMKELFHPNAATMIGQQLLSLAGMRSGSNG